jgi:DNA topoisomerase IB
MMSKATNRVLIRVWLMNISGKLLKGVYVKDFRTWTGTVQALVAFKEVGEFENKTEARKIVEVLDKVAKHLGNTRGVCENIMCIQPL